MARSSKTPDITRTSRGPLRAALALEEAGDLQEAARLFEYAGEHAQAASLRLEHADTLRDEQQRLSVLREGAARNPPNTEQGRALHRALGEALLRVAEGIEPSARKRALILEAAHALEAGQRSSEAGRIYERLGLLSRAAKAYADAGDIERLESVHRELDARDLRETEQRSLQREIDSAMQTGRRQLAHRLLLDHLGLAERERHTPNPALQLVLAQLQQMAVRDRSFRLLIGDSPQHRAEIRVVGRDRLRMGRGPECELRLDGAALSRQHAELALATETDDVLILVRDLGSRAGTFVDGVPLGPGDDLVVSGPERTSAESHEVALGIAASLELVPARSESDERPVLLVRSASEQTTPPSWTLFCPLGGRLFLNPENELPVTVDFNGEHVNFMVPPTTSLYLNGTVVGLGASIEVLIGDEIRLVDEGRIERIMRICSL